MKPSTARPRFLPYPLSLLNIQSSSGGQNKIITSKVAINPLSCQNCN